MILLERNIRLPIFSDEPEKQRGWHGEQLKKSFAKHDIEVIFISLQDCYLSLTGGQSVILPTFDKLPKAVFVRSIAGGTLQQITMRLNILHVLKLQNVKVYNEPRAIERTVDKAMTSFLLHRNGIAIPKTWACESRHTAQNIIQKSHKKLLIKPIFGSQGTGVRLLEKDALPMPQEIFVDGVYYLQQFIDSGDNPHDYRVFIINHQAIATMKRSGNTWINNVAKGAQCEQVEDIEITKLAELASNIMDLDYCGVDIIRDQFGKLYVLEVNSIPAWRGLQGVTQVNIADALVDDLLFKMI